MPAAERPRDLVIKFNDGTTASTADFRGHVAVLAFVKLNTCHAGQSIELIERVFLDLRDQGVRSLGCCVDLEPGQPIPEFPLGEHTPVGWATRRKVADYLGIPMSGFHLPHYVLLDRNGLRRQSCSPNGTNGWELVQSLREPVEQLLSVPAGEVEPAAALWEGATQ